MGHVNGQMVMGMLGRIGGRHCPRFDINAGRVALEAAAKVSAGLTACRIQGFFRIRQVPRARRGKKHQRFSACHKVRGLQRFFAARQTSMRTKDTAHRRPAPPWQACRQTAVVARNCGRGQETSPVADAIARSGACAGNLGLNIWPAVACHCSARGRPWAARLIPKVGFRTFAKGRNQDRAQRWQADPAPANPCAWKGALRIRRGIHRAGRSGAVLGAHRICLSRPGQGILAAKALRAG